MDARSAGGGDGVFDGSETVEAFSSDGPRRIFFKPDGTPITPGDFGAEGGEVVAKPDLAAADGVSTATPGFGDFHGTSAAAPHAAAIAALALQAAGGPRRTTMAELRAALASGALDIGAEGADRNAGAGIAMAPAAVEALRSADAHRAPTVAAAIADRTLIALSDPDTLDLDLHFDDADGDALAYSARVDDPAVVAAEIDGSTLSVAPGGRGATAVTVRATDPGGLSALTSFAVAVDREWGSTDYDDDDDGLIEISTLEQLDAVRHDLDGDSVEDEPGAGPPYFGAFPDAARDMGCATGCTGFELTRDLDFDDPASYASGRADRGWSAAEGGPGWEPIGAVVSVDPIAGPRFDADFLGNGHSIANLFVDRPETDGVGLFGHVGGTRPPGGTIGGLALVDVDVAGRDYVGGLVGAHDEYRVADRGYWRRDVEVVAVSVEGRVSGRDAVGGLAGLGGFQTARSFAAVRVSGEARVGGLVGETDDIRHAFGTISESYATGPVSGDDRVGGLVGEHHGVVSACYATGRVRAARRAGGLVGAAHGEVGASYSTGPVLGGTRGGLFGFVDRGTPLRASYWDVETSGVPDDQGPLGRSAGRTTAELALPGGYRGPYANWNVDLDRDDRGRTARGPDDPWHFGGKSQYPALRGGAAGWRGFGRQLRERPRLSLAASDGVAELAWTEPGTAHWSPPPEVVYDVYRNDALLAAGVDGTAFRDLPPAGTAAHRYQVVARIGEGEPVRSNVAAVGNRPPFAAPLADRVARADEAFGYAFAAAGDPDGDAVSYDARGMPAWLSFDPAARSFSGTPAEGDAGAATVEVTATDAGTPTLSTVATFALTVNPPADNRAPEATGAIAALSMATGDVEAVAVADAFEDPDGDALAFEAAAADAGVAAAAATGAAVTVTATGAGRTTVTVTASDGGLEAERTFAVGVANAPPRAAGSVAEVRLTVPGAAAIVDVGAHFEDPDGDALAYSARSSDPGVADVEVDGTLATVTPLGAGRATLTISATDSGGSGATARLAAQVVVEADYDADDDGLVEIQSLAQLDVIRHDMDGDGLVSDLGKSRLNYPGRLALYEAAFPQAAPGMGCPAGCVGYELAADLDFDTDGDGRVGPGDAFWNDGAGWDPLGGYSGDTTFIPHNSALGGVFEGNGHRISRLFIDRRATGAGLFGRTAPSGTVRNVRLAGADVSGGSFYVGTLVGNHAGSVHGSSATGSVSGGSNVGGLVGYADIGSEVGAGSAYVRTTGESGVGGLIGGNWGTVRDVRAAGDVTGAGFDIGGLIGVNYRLGTASRCYATGDVSGVIGQIGGLAGRNDGTIAACHAAGTTGGGYYTVGGLVGWLSSGTISASYTGATVLGPADGLERGALVGWHLRGTIAAAYSERLANDRVAIGEPQSRRGSRTTADLLAPTGYAGIYAGWNVDLDGDGEGDDPWVFAPGGYPVLKLDADGDGTATWGEFGPQRGPVRLRVAAAETEDGSEDPGIVASWDPPADTAGAAVLGYEVQRRVGDGIFLAADPPHEGTATEYADDAPPAGAGHAYRVRALTDEGPTGWSPPASTAPGAPDLEAVPGTGGAVLTWTDPEDTGTSAVTGYQYQRHAEGADAWDPPWTDVPADAAAERSYTVDGLVDGTRYGFELRAVNASGPGFGSARAMVVAGTPGPPRDLRAVAGDGIVTLGWTPPADPGASPVTGYEHRHSGDGGASWRAWIPVPGGPVQEHAVAGLANAAAYVFEVRAVNDVGPGPGARVDVRTPPAATGSIPPLSFAAHGDEATVDLGLFFAVAPGGTLSFEARSADPELVSVRVEGDRLVLVPNDDGEDGETTVTVRAVDGEGRAVETVFAVSVEPLPGWWRRWGFDVVAELLAREPAEGMPARAE